jgi:hypothetical protein
MKGFLVGLIALAILGVAGSAAALPSTHTGMQYTAECGGKVDAECRECTGGYTNVAPAGQDPKWVCNGWTQCLVYVLGGCHDAY